MTSTNEKDLVHGGRRRLLPDTMPLQMQGF